MFFFSIKQLDYSLSISNAWIHNATPLTIYHNLSENGIRDRTLVDLC